ncbi:peptide/nickel transport system permease protein [Paramixta manurensis]|uniref:Peptide/nickel transport system permease protein n=1 Tax=Paramixta manurensis TaxID=2740817 RepID=A0A6M8UNM6_9GAMM|nr:peptide/nickel transport system permease protein [Erwiniaceae bacterium PD-1]
MSSLIESTSPGVRRARQLGQRLALRGVGGVLVLLASASVTFFALHLTPGDPVRAILGGPSANPTPETIAAAIKEFGLDKPLIEQYGIWLLRLLHGDFGRSFSQHQPVVEVIRQQLVPTLQLTAAALFAAWLLALISVLGTARRNRWLSGLGSLLETLSAALPQFWLALVLLAVFSFGLQWFPPEGNDGLLSLVLPALALAIPLAGFLAQVMREAFELALDQPFILSARARGLSEWQVRLGHGLRHAVLPGVSLSAWAVGSLVGNSVLVELIFSRQGLGRQLYQAVSLQDMPLTIGITLFITLVYILTSLLVDFLYTLVDPRLSEVHG